MNRQKLRDHINRSPFFIKLFNWEYWPILVANIPLILFAIWFAVRARRATFFTNINATIETSGLFGESKINILRQIPNSHLPKTVFVPKVHATEEIIAQIEAKGITFPVVVKPDVGERGLLVKVVHTRADLIDWLDKHPIDLLIQEFVDWPVELAVLHYRFPNEKAGRITSICIKDSLKVTGDGKSTVRQLMQNFPRALLQLPRFEAQNPEILDKILAPGASRELEPIGNHSRGTTFLNGNHLISPEMEAVFNQISVQMKDIHYGRFDLKCPSVEELLQGKMKILEYNGIGGEPAHIYDPSYPIWKKYRDIYRQWKLIYQIHRMQIKRGVKPDTVLQTLKFLQKYRAYMKSVKNTKA